MLTSFFEKLETVIIIVPTWLLICTLISENQGLFQTLKKFQVLQALIFFSGLHPQRKLGLYYKPEKKSQLKKNQGLQNLKYS